MGIYTENVVKVSISANRYGKYKSAIVILVLSILVFNVAGYNYFLTREQKSVVKILAPVFTYLIYIGAKKIDPTGDLEKIVYSFFTVSLGFLAAWYLSGFKQFLPEIVPDSVMDWAISKLGEAVPISAVIILLGRSNGDSLKSLKVTGGNIAKSLGYGLVASLLGLVQYVTMVGFTLPTSTMFLTSLPWLLIFSVSNSFMEELMFRGLFLGKYNELFGEKGALVLVSIVFAILHVALLPFMGLTMMLVFVSFLFVQGYVWGFVIQKSDSIWGAVLAHTAADILFVLAAFS